MSAIPEFVIKLAFTEEEARAFCADGNIVSQPRFPKSIGVAISAIESQLRPALAKYQPLQVGDRVHHASSKKRTGVILSFVDTPDGPYVVVKLDEAQRSPVSTYALKDVRRFTPEEVEADAVTS